MNKITLNEFYKRATAKNMKSMRGHDGPAHGWDIYFDNKKICYCWDDSYGGELKVDNYGGQSIENIWGAVDYESTYDKAWGWHTDMRLALHEVHTETRFLKDAKKGVLVGFNRSNYDIIGYKKSILDMLTLNKDYRLEYEKIYTEEGHCKGDNKVINWQYLEGCDIKVPEQYRWNKVDYVNRIMKRQ